MGDRLRQRPPCTRLARLGLILLALLALPLAEAGGAFQAGPVTLVIDDARGTDCASSVLGFCQLEVRHADDPGQAEVDAHQHIRYVGVAIEPPVEPPVEVLPDGGLFFRPSDVSFYVPYREGVLAIVTLVPSPGESSIVHWKWHKDASIELFYPKIDGVTKGNNRYGGLDVQSMPGFQNGTFGLRNLYVPLNSTDGYIAGTTGCGPRLGCVDSVGATPLVLAATPNAHATVAVVEASVATDPEDLGPRDLDNATRAAASTSIPLRFASAPPPRLGRETPQDGPRLEWAEPTGPTPDADPKATRPNAPRTSAAEVANAALQDAHSPPWAAIATTAATAALLALLGFGLYSRIRTERDALQSRPRLRIHRLVLDAPGISTAELAARAELSRNATMHHVRVLERAGLVRVERAQGRALTFPRAEGVAGAKQALARLHADDPVLRLLRDTPGLTREEIHERLEGMPLRTRNHRLKRLFDMDLVRVEGEAGAYRHYLRH